MSKKLTITVDDEVYAGLHNVIGRRRISRFLNELARRHVLQRELAAGYRAMAADEDRERAAMEWVENVTGDIASEPRQAAASSARKAPQL
jgi:predicted CopG family antitoxin